MYCVTLGQRVGQIAHCSHNFKTLLLAIMPEMAEYDNLSSFYTARGKFVY